MSGFAQKLSHGGAAGRNGFTLVELLVSLFIFAMLAAAAVILLSFSVRVQERPRPASPTWPVSAAPAP